MELTLRAPPLSPPHSPPGQAHINKDGVSHAPALKAHKLLEGDLQAVRMGRTDPAPRVASQGDLPPKELHTSHVPSSELTLGARDTGTGSIPTCEDHPAQKGGTESQGFRCTREQQGSEQSFGLRQGSVWM